MDSMGVCGHQSLLESCGTLFLRIILRPGFHLFIKQMRADPATKREVEASFQQLFYLNCLSGAVFLKVGSLDYWCSEGRGRMIGLCSNEFGKHGAKVKQSSLLEYLKNE